MNYWKIPGTESPRGRKYSSLRSLSSFIAFAAILLGTSACTTSDRSPSAKVIDQSFDALEASRGTIWENTGAGIGLGNDSEAAQTFTIGRSGIMTAVAVQIFRGTNSVKNVSLEIRRTANRIPSESDSDVLALETIPLKDIPFELPIFVPVNLKNQCLFVHQGEVLAIVLKNRDMQSGCSWQTVSDDHYYEGERFAKNRDTNGWISRGMGLTGHDLGFKTYVDPDYSCETK